MSVAFSEIACSLVVSAYKGLTSTLVTAQQSYALRPFFNAKIIDDTVQPNQVISTNLPPLSNGTAVTAPDGTILAVGLDASGNVVLYKASNLHSGAWTSTKIIEAVGGTFNNDLNRYSIQVSDYVNGTYTVSIAYFSNFVNSSSPLNANLWVSNDGGTSFPTHYITSMPAIMASSKYQSGVAFRLNLSIAAIKPRIVAGVMKFGYFTVQPNSNVLFPSVVQAYDIAYAYGDTGSLTFGTTWSERFVNSNDWILHSLDTYYLNGKDHIIFSGYRNFIDTPNTIVQSSAVSIRPIYGIWATYIENIGNGSNNADAGVVGDVWFTPRQVLNSIAVGSTNRNIFTFPCVSIINGLVNLTFFAQTVDSIISQTTGAVSLHYSYFLVQSINGIDFSYPNSLVMSDGSEFSGNTNQISGVSYVSQGQYIYLLGSGKVWEFIQNNIVADVSNDIIQYTISESAGQPSSITLQLGNANNDWVGASPTNPGASAISGNRKIVFQQGYYNANGVPETVPRNVYFIDDINQNVSNTDNNVTISGRDLYKRLKTLITKWAFNWFGPLFYVDNFDGTTLGNWSQQTSGWVEDTNTLTTSSAPVGDSNILLSNIPRITEASVMAVGIKGNTTGHVYVYAYYFDSGNFLRLNYNFASTPHFIIEKCVAGSLTTLTSDNSSTIPNGETHMLFVRQYDYFKFAFVLSAVSTGNTIDAFLSNNVIGSGEYDMTSTIIALQSSQWSVGLGANGVSPVFTNFQYSQFNFSNNISEIIQRLATKAGVFAYNIQEVFTDFFFNSSDWYPGGDSTTFNRILKIFGISDYYKTDQIVSDGEVTFRAACIPQVGVTANQFAFYFRTDSPTAPTSGYRLRVRAQSGTTINVGFDRLYQGTWYPFPSCQKFLINTAKGGLNFDITQPHTYRVVFASGWMYAFIDDIMVCSWNDNNTTSSYLTTGYIGFGSLSLSNLLIYGISATAFWKQSPSFSLNPGDDIESAVLAASQSIRAWIFSDLFGALKAVLLNSNDISTYTYQNQLYVQGVDSSDKEYVSQVTVYGNGVSATARNTSLMVGAATRELVIVDYTITAQQDAQSRANYELSNSNQYRVQLNPKQVLNVGAEIFDAVQVVDTGNNSSGVNTTTRVYAQKMTTGGKNNEYSLELDTGNL